MHRMGLITGNGSAADDKASAGLLRTGACLGTGSAGRVPGLLRNTCQGEIKDGTGIGLGIRPYHAAVAVDNALDGGQAHTGALEIFAAM